MSRPFAVFRMLAIVGLLALVPHAAALAAADGAGRVSLRIEGDLITIRAEDATLKQVLEAIAAKQGFDVILRGDLDQKIDRTLTRVPLADALRRLLGRHSMVTTYRTTDAGATVLAELRVYAASAPATTRIAGRATPSPAARSAFDGLDPAAQIATIRALIQNGSPSAVTALEGIVGRAANAAVRRYAINGLARVGGQGATRVLGRIVTRDDKPDSRRAAVRALARMRTDDARAFVEQASRDADKRVRQTASVVLRRWR
jgi:HEAT repeats